MITLIISLISLFFQGEKQDPVVDIYSFKQFESRFLNSQSDTLYVINFWATWCKPCVEELPELEKLNNHFNDSKVKVVLVSLDFKSMYHSRLIPFLSDNYLTSEVILLNETDYNSWINKVSKEWGGAIPATLIRNSTTNSSKFIEGQTDFNQLLITINSLHP